MKYRWYMILCLAQLANAVCNYCGDGLQPILPSTLTIPPPDSSNSSFDQCNLMGGVYQCIYHSLFDCDPNINHFYTWNTNDLNDLQTITAEFPVPVQTVNVITYSPFNTPTVRVQVGPQQVIIGNSRNTFERSITETTNRGHDNLMITLPFEVNEINPLSISANTAVTITNIIFCARIENVAVFNEMSPSSSTSSSTSTSTLSSLSSLSLPPMTLSTSSSKSITPSASSTPYLSTSPMSLPSLSTLRTLSMPSLSSLTLLLSTPSSSTPLLSTPSPSLSASSKISLSTYTLPSPVTTTPIADSPASDSNILLFIGISVLVITLLLAAMVLLIICWCCHCCKMSYSARRMKMITGRLDTTTVHNIPNINPNPAYGVIQHPLTIYDEAVILKPNPSYGIVAQHQRKRQLNDNYDYVVDDGEVIKTDHNPSYVTTTVGSNELQDNPAYKPAFVAVV